MKGSLSRLAVALLLLLLGGAIALLTQRDGERPDDADLMQTAAPIVEHENGYITLSAASELLVWPEDEALGDLLTDMAHGSGWDAELAARLLAENERALSAFARVTRNPGFQSPADPNADRTDPVDVLDLGRLLSIRSRAAAQRGDRRAALEDALLALQVGKRIGADPHGGFLSAYTGIVVAEAGLDAIRAALALFPLSAAESQQLTNELSTLRVDADAWRRVLAAEYRAERWTFDAKEPIASVELEGEAPAVKLVSLYLPNGYLLQPNNSLRMYANGVRESQNRAGEPCGSGPSSMPRVRVADLLRPNAFGARAAALSLRELARGDRARCAYDTRVELTRAAIGLHAFERERGVLPPSLEALVPSYLDPAPIDAFSGEGLRFRRADRVIYSIGSDGADGGGVEIAGDTDDREPSLALPPLSPS